MLNSMLVYRISFLFLFSAEHQKIGFSLIYFNPGAVFPPQTVFKRQLIS